MSTWRFLNSGFADGTTNMAVDEALLEGVGRGTSPPTVRVYGWRPPTVSTGYSQDLGRELDLDACSRLGFGVVRRPTGGRAVLHAGELTYSVVGHAGAAPLGNTIMESYLAIAQGLLAGLARLGVAAELVQVGAEPRATRSGASPPCFASAGRYEVVLGGRKLVGSAQRRREGSILQHGSLLIDDTHERIADVLRIDEPLRRAVRRSLAEKTVNLTAILGRPVGFEETAGAMRLGFEEAWGIVLAEGVLSDDEKDTAGSLATRSPTEG
jgi:lipoate-protein ligase A